MVEWKKLIILGMGSYDIVPLAELVAPEDTEGAIIVVKSSRPNRLKSLEKEIYLIHFLAVERLFNAFGVKSPQRMVIYVGIKTIETSNPSKF